MIRLHPIPDADHTCPYCQVRLEVRGWYIPGMRNLADLRCLQCGREFYGDLPAGHGLHYPMLLEKATGIVHDRWGVKWFADWLHTSYAQKQNEPLGFIIEEAKPIRRAVLLNCLDRLYGHCLLKLLNAQYYLDHKRDLGLIVLVPRLLRWMVPEGVAAIWTVDLPLEKGIEWNDWLAQEIHRRITALDECYLSIAFSHPHPDDFDIERFSKVRPFPLNEWEERLGKPTVTFIWREDRFWNGLSSLEVSLLIQKTINRIRKRLGYPPVAIHEQRRKVIILASKLRERFPTIDFAVVGLGRPGGLPDWILDLRVPEIDEATELIWCKRYAQSHVVIGVHGSNMLLPSAHAGAVVELMPNERWGNILQDLLLRRDDQRETLFRYRVLPITTSVDALCDVTTSILSDRAGMLLHMQREWCKHESMLGAFAWRDARLRTRVLEGE